MAQPDEIIGYVNVGVFVALGIAALLRWRRLRDRTSVWAAASFGSLALVVLAGQLPEQSGALEDAIQRVIVLLLILFPFLLYRFMVSIDPPRAWLTAVVTFANAALVVATVALPSIPGEGEARPTWFTVWIIAFLAVWTLTSAVVALRFWRAARAEPSVAHRRMQMLGIATAAITLALFIAASAPDPPLAVSVVVGLLATVSAVAFLLGIWPPLLVRMVWRRPEERQAQEAVQGLVALARDPAEIAARVLPPLARLAGARQIVLLDARGEVVASHGTAVDGRPALRIGIPGGALLVRTGPYSPYFGTEEIALLTTIGSLIELALDRAKLFAQERAARLELERANELQANFISLAAHELRTPITAVHGIVTTLDRLGDTVPQADRLELRATLRSQAERMRALVEQLLDLSRLDASAAPLEPRRVAVRDSVEEIVGTVAGDRAADVAISIPEQLEVVADPSAFERIVSNLVTNALRHGRPPIEVIAQQGDNHFRLRVEDRGPGVAPEFEGELFERFARSPEARARGEGTGLGLAIARAYARGHGGDLLYSPLPEGSCFELVLPTGGESARADALLAVGERVDRPVQADAGLSAASS